MFSKERGEGPTISRVFASIRRFTKWAHEQPGGLFLRHGSPVKGVKELAVDEPDCKKLEKEDVHRLLRAADGLVGMNELEGVKRHKMARPRHNRAILALLLYTVVRVSELVALKLEQPQGKHLVNVVRKGQART